MKQAIHCKEDDDSDESDDDDDDDKAGNWTAGMCSAKCSV